MNSDPIIVMVHYHLRRGGVTRVIQNAVSALATHPVRCVVLTGEPPPAGINFEAPVCVVEGLGYDEGRNSVDPDDLLQRVRAAVRKEMGRAADIWHIHNHALGKNVAWTKAVARLCMEGDACCLQIHDFAEDGRPENYRTLRDQLGGHADWADLLYPCGAHTQYVLLNRRDQQIMMQAGLPSSRAFRLPNAVQVDAVSPTSESSQKSGPPLVLYPSRAIRRKNVGEFLLWSAMDQADTRYGITLAPQSPGDRPNYDRWVKFAVDTALPVSFEMGAQVSYGELLNAATALATTSIAEGFGLAFLEPWSVGLPLFGRNLPEITYEFEEAGLRFPGLYNSLTVPSDWVDLESLRAALEKSLTDSRHAYGKSTEASDIEEALDVALRDDRIEFGHLDERIQEQVIRRVKASSDAASSVSPNSLMDAETPSCVEDNRRVIEKEYSLSTYGQRLMDIYDGVNHGAGDVSVQAEKVLEAFIAPSRFYLMRS